MSEAVLKLAGAPLRVAVESPDPRRKEFLSRLVADLGYVVAARQPGANVVLAEGMPVDGFVPTVALGMEGDRYQAKLPLTASPEQIDAALRAVAVGLSVGMAEQPGSRFDSVSDVDEAALLTPRELEVLSAVADGLTNKEIAQRLGISRHTVKFHLESLMRKLHVSSRAGAVSMSMRRKLLAPYRL
jgi:DNA-binding NarL/FixJ family response regulator